MVLDVERTTRRPGERSPSSARRDCRVVVVGAGPYGLSVGAHLRAIDGVDVTVFGPRMSFWQTNMPKGMLLRSPWPACNLSDPEGELTLGRYRDVSGRGFGSPVPLDCFVDYGHWFAEQTLGDRVDRRLVALVEREGDGFRVVLEDGEAVHADRVVVAAGISNFARRPREFESLGDRVSHAVDHDDLSIFAGRRVAVVGAGQSALESAALLHEAGSDVRVIARAPRIRYLIKKLRHKLPLISHVLYAPPDVGPPLASWLVALPALYRRLPRKWQDKLSPRSIRPAGAAWLVPRLQEVPIELGRSVVGAESVNGHVDLRLDDGSRREVDHVLLATGYRIDLAEYRFLARDLVGAIDDVDGYPRLSKSFETSVPGLYMVGAPAAWSMGPLMRFVAGADFAASSVADGVGAAVAAR
jgi:cation diffusion facilitator CzcD-associated flavoprotein CzcO